MPGNVPELAGASDLNAHIGADPNTVHQILDRAKSIMSTFVPLTPTALTMTNDGGWHDLSLAAYVPVNVVQVRLWVRCGLTGRWVSFLFGPAGTAADGSATASVRWAMTTPIHKDYLDFPPFDLTLTSQTMAYKTSNEAGATVDKAYLTGYWRKGL